MLLFFNQLAGLNLIQIPKKPDGSSQWPLFLRLFLSKEVSHPLGNINVHPHLIHLSFAQLFSYLYLMVPHYHTMLHQYTLPPFFYHYLKWKYKKRENGNIWAKRNKCFTASINPHHFIFLQCTLLYRVSPFHNTYYCHVPQNQIVLVTIERTTVPQK